MSWYLEFTFRRQGCLVQGSRRECLECHGISGAEEMNPVRTSGRCHQCNDFPVYDTQQSGPSSVDGKSPNHFLMEVVSRAQSSKSATITSRSRGNLAVDKKNDYPKCRPLLCTMTDNGDLENTVVFNRRTAFHVPFFRKERLMQKRRPSKSYWKNTWKKSASCVLRNPTTCQGEWTLWPPYKL